MVDRLVNDLLRERFRLSAHFAHTVEENDRVVQGVPDQSQERRDGREPDLELGNAEERERAGDEVAHADEAEYDEHVVGNPDDRGQTVDRALKAEPQIGDNAQQAAQNGEDALGSRVARDGGTDDIRRFKRRLRIRDLLSFLSERFDRGRVFGIEDDVPVVRRFVGAFFVTFAGNGEFERILFIGDVGEVAVDDLFGERRIHADGNDRLTLNRVGPGGRNVLRFADRVVHRVMTQFAGEFFFEELFDLRLEIDRFHIDRAGRADGVARIVGDFVPFLVFAEGQGADREVGKVFFQAGTEIADIDRFVKDELDFDTADEVDVEDALAANKDGRDTDDDNNNGDPNGLLKELEVVPIRTSKLLHAGNERGNALRTDDPELLARLEDDTADVGRRKHAEQNAEEEGDGERFDLFGSDQIQNPRGEHGRNVRVENRGERALITVADGHADGRAAGELFTNTFENKYVRVDRHTDGQYETGKTGQGERRVHSDHRHHNEDEVHNDRERRDAAAEPVVDNHEDENDNTGPKNRVLAFADRIGAERRAGDLFGNRFIGKFRGEDAGVHNGDEVANFALNALTRFGGEIVAERNRAAVADRALNVRSAEQAVVEDDAELAALVAARIRLIAVGQQLHVLGAFVLHGEEDFRLAHIADAFLNEVDVIAVDDEVLLQFENENVVVGRGGRFFFIARLERRIAVDDALADAVFLSGVDRQPRITDDDAVADDLIVRETV